MKSLIALLLILSFRSVVFCAEAEDFSLRIIVIRGIQSKANPSQKTTLTVSGDKVIYEITYTSLGQVRATDRKEFKLKRKDRQTLQLLTSKNLLVTKTIRRPLGTWGRYPHFELLIDSTVNDRKGQIRIKGPSNATDLNESKLFTDSVALVKVIYTIMESADKKMSFEPLVK
jgi:hypothetical protein